MTQYKLQCAAYSAVFWTRSNLAQWLMRWTKRTCHRHHLPRGLRLLDRRSPRPTTSCWPLETLDLDDAWPSTLNVISVFSDERYIYPPRIKRCEGELVHITHTGEWRVDLWRTQQPPWKPNGWKRAGTVCDWLLYSRNAEMPKCRTDLKAVIRPRAELHRTALVIKREICDVDLTGAA